MNKYTIFTIFLFIASLFSCRQKSVIEYVLIFSKSEYKLHYFFNDFKPTTRTISDSVFYGGNHFWVNSPKQKDDRPYSLRICRINNTSTDTIKIITVGEVVEYEMEGFDRFNVFDFCNNIELNLGKNHPNIMEFTNHVKSIQSNDYFELLPNQECIALPRRD